MQPSSRGRPKSPGRGRAPARWTGLEITLIVLSVLMIAYPLFSGAVGLVAPPPAPAQESTTDPAQAPTDTPDPVFPQPSETAPPPPPSDTPLPPPSDTPVPPLPSDTTVPPPASNTPEPPSPSETPSDGGNQQVGTATSRPITATPTVGTSTETATVTTGAGTPSPIPGSPTNTPTVTNTPNPSFSATPVTTQPPVDGVRVFKIASVSEAAPEQNFSYSVTVITSSATDQTVTLNDSVDANLEVLSASSSSGTCTAGQLVVCTLTIRDDNPASVTIQVRVRPGVPVDTTILNSASAGGATSAPIGVRISGAGTPLPSPTAQTAVATATGIPGGSPTSAAPTNTPVPPPAPAPRDDGDSGGDGDSDSGGSEAPVAPPAPPTPVLGVPTEPPTPETVVGSDPARPIVRPTAAVRPTRVVIGATNTAAPAGTVVVPTGSPQPSVAPAGGAGDNIFFRIASDWGSAYPGQQVNFTIVVRNTRAAAAGGANAVRNVTVTSALPSNVQVIGARADRGSDPSVAGNDVSYSIAQLQPGEGVEITVATQIRSNVTIGTLLVAQAQLRYEGLAQAAFSNIVSVQVVGNAQPPTAAAVGGTAVAQQASPTTGAYPAPTTGTAVRTATAGTTTTPSAVVQQPSAVPTAVRPPAQPAPLPDTSTGVPLLGIALLGSTLLTRTWRLHRARNRI